MVIVEAIHLAVCESNPMAPYLLRKDDLGVCVVCALFDEFPIAEATLNNEVPSLADYLMGLLRTEKHKSKNLDFNQSIPIKINF